MKINVRRIVLLIGLLCMSAAPVKALELWDSKIAIHGFGHQGYMLSNHNEYLGHESNVLLGSDNRGSFNFNNFGLLFSVVATDDLTIWAQLLSDDQTAIRLDWAFIDYKFNDQFRVRGGQIRDTLGIMSEIRDIKYLQHSATLPFIYQPEAEFITESYRGAALVYTPEFLNSSFTFDLYGGMPVLDDEHDEDKLIRNLIGGRIKYDTPIEGLSLIASASTSHEEKTDPEEKSGEQNFYMGSVVYKNYDLTVKAEYGLQTDAEKDRYAYYAQAGYTFFDKLTPFVRYDFISKDKNKVGDTRRYQQDFVFGVNYKFNKYVALTVEDHLLEGFAMADKESEGKKNWNLFAASLNFIF